MICELPGEIQAAERVEPQAFGSGNCGDAAFRFVRDVAFRLPLLKL